MTNDFLTRRFALLARIDAALARWPERSGAAFDAEAAAIADELDALARSIDRSDIEPIERLRSWRQTGEAYLRIGGRGPLQRASEAFRSAEALAQEADAGAAELVQLKHAFGSTLLRLAAGESEELALAAATRLSTALALARKHAPENVAAIKHELLRAEHSATLLRMRARSGQTVAA